MRGVAIWFQGHVLLVLRVPPAILQAMTLFSSLGRAFWTAWNADSIFGVCEAEGVPSFCVSDVIVSKEETAHSGDPLAGAIHVDCDLGKGAMGPAEWIGSGATPMSALVLPLGVHSPLAYMGSFHLLRFLCCVVYVPSRHHILPVVGGHVG